MTRDEVLEQLKVQRAQFDARIHAIPGDSLDEPVPGSLHSPKQIVAHVSAYERLIVDRIRAARLGEKTAFDRDRIGWEAFNDRIWAESAEQSARHGSGSLGSRLLGATRGGRQPRQRRALRDARRLGGHRPRMAAGTHSVRGHRRRRLRALPAHFAQLEAAAERA